MGSCFTDNIGTLLQQNLFNIVVNPFGVTYNPMSLAGNLEKLLDKEEYTREDLYLQNELYLSFDHYSGFSDPDPDVALERINSAFQKAKENLGPDSTLLLTFGTSYIYTLKSSSEVVNNCHKLPAADFNRRRLTVEEITSRYVQLLERIWSEKGKLKVLFTVSPVRHLKDGFSENSRSKAILLLAIEELVEKYPDRCAYFPAYELMMDDLRDYRFFENDMVHPNGQAIDYIWNAFKGAVLDKESLRIMAELKSWIKAKQHRPMHTSTRSYSKFMENTEATGKKLRNDYPFLNWPE